MKYCYETGMQDNINTSQHLVSTGHCGEGHTVAVLSATAADSISACQAAVPGDLSTVTLPSTVLCLSAGLSLVKQTHYPCWLPYRQAEGGDGKQEVMICSVQVKLAPLITPLIGQLQNAMLLHGMAVWLTINDMFLLWRNSFCWNIFVYLETLPSHCLCFSVFGGTVDTCLLVD